MKATAFQLSDDNDDGEEFTLDEWLNMNSFVVRLGMEYISFGLWEMRTGLEGPEKEGESASETVSNTCILVATRWIIQGGRDFCESHYLMPYHMRRLVVSHGEAVFCVLVLGYSISSDGAFGSADLGRYEILQLNPLRNRLMKL